MKLFETLFAVLACVCSLAYAHLDHDEHMQQHEHVSRDTTRYVFAHFIIGIVGNRASAADYDADMQRAKAMGIDAFALNIGTDSYTDTQLGYAYTSANNNGMKVFISFDFNFWSTGDATTIGQKIAQYKGLPAQLMVDSKPFVSSFVGDGVDVTALRNAVGSSIYFAPNFHPSYGTSMSQVDGALNWVGWPNNGNNRAPNPGQTGTVEAGDQQYINALGGKGYIAPVSPWFFTHYGAEVSYSKNWLFPTDAFWFQRWSEILTLGPRFIEIVTWNDYGESSYVGPLNARHTDDGASKWVNDMPHDGWLDMAKPFIAAYKAGATSVNNYITSDQLIYWYRPQPKTVDCSSTDTCMGNANNASGNYYIGPPNGWQTVSDSVFVVALLKSAGTLQVTSGQNSQTFNAPAGASNFSINMGTGQQKFALTRNGAAVSGMSGTSLKDIINGCVCGLYNYNAYVGTLPAGASDPLPADGYAAFSSGLRVSTCQPTPSLGTATPAPTTTGKATTITTTTTAKASSTTLATATTSASAAACTAGTGDGNYSGLCSFCCSYNYCPAGPCTCTGTGAAQSPPPETGTKGVPADGEDQSYAGLCSYACNHGYCPSTACKVAS